MSLTLAQTEDLSVEECLDDFGEALRALQRYPPTVLAVALRVHLEALLQGLLESRLCTAAEVRAFLKELEREALAQEPR